ncbi:MAG: hypothetical protein LIP00_10410, partial [Parabacteroides sp.]|nr:hypothetical protein [Parabacteroides sp.]
MMQVNEQTVFTPAVACRRKQSFHCSGQGKAGSAGVFYVARKKGRIISSLRTIAFLNSVTNIGINRV